ncbi:Spx/MgsR family RNA polymerase-binding regulatory protein [Maridesulfovibrio zosterae]|uniref:Spx/MgsR family RNA polymerase-binding regulatory protein n=1 Tax=Maridesulfovibrio zosterae TaxID=82171 RepID=UPI00041993A2|nr:Spx/MgsR family RNA polymerase-binding regulatory protein [Maridesulfovibrio zosterae]
MSLILVHYPSCSTSRKAKAWLEVRGVDFVVRHMMKETPTAVELLMWQKIAGVDKKKFVNTNGKKYRELGLKETIGSLSDREVFDLISTDGMLIKRPLLVADDFVLIGFKIKEWEEQFSTSA